MCSCRKRAERKEALSSPASIAPIRTELLGRFPDSPPTPFGLRRAYSGGTAWASHPLPLSPGRCRFWSAEYSTLKLLVRGWWMVVHGMWYHSPPTTNHQRATLCSHASTLPV